MKFLILLLCLILTNCSNNNLDNYHPNELSYSGIIQIKENTLSLNIEKSEYKNSQNLTSQKVILLPENNKIEKLNLFIQNSHKRGIFYFTVIGKLSKKVEKGNLHFLVSIIKSKDNFGESFKAKPL